MRSVGRRASATATSIAFALAALMGPAAWAENSSAPNPAHPWEKDQALLDAVDAAYNSGGIMVVQTYASRLEQALAGAKASYVVDEPKGNISYRLTDGRVDTLGALLLGTFDRNHTEVELVAVKDPYPAISLYLGLYYDEIGKPDDALRVIDKSLSLLTETGEHRPSLMAERGAALAELKQWPDVLKNFEEGLKLPRLDESMKARMYRGKGMALTELGRLDEAEAAYKESLVHEPESARAVTELTYIARLRAGAAPTAPTLLPLKDTAASAARAPH